MLDKTITIDTIDTIDTIKTIIKKKKRTNKKRLICRPILFISDSSSSDTE